MTENASQKAARLLTSGRLTVQQLGPEGLIVASCRGDSGRVYTLGFDPGKEQWRCTCPARSDQCSHLIGLRLVVVRQ